jgi:DNA-binding IclR family transcriptional regulator
MIDTPTNKGRRPKNLVQAIERGLNLVDILSRFPQGLNLGDLSNMSGLSKGTTHRLLATLAYLDYVRQDATTRVYTLGFKLAELGNILLNQLDLRNVARPHLVRLSEQMQETVHLVIRDVNKALYIDKVDLYPREAGLQMVSRLGSRAPMHSCAVGKILLASLTTEKVEGLIGLNDLPTKTDNTISDAAKLISHLELVRKNGYAIDNEENEMGIRCVAAPIFNDSGRVVAAISLSGPATRITLRHIKTSLNKNIRDTALNISRDLGYRGDGALYNTQC